MSQLMDAKDLARWTRFANKGGIGKCTALSDCVAQGNDDLMFLADDEITVLMQLPEESVFLGYCEGVVGRFNGKDVRFHSKLKKPVIQKRTSTSTASLKSISPIHSPSLPHDDLHDPSDANSGRLSLPPLPRPSRTSTITDEIQEKNAANRPKSSISNRSSSRPSTPPKPSTTMNKRRGLISTDSISVPAGSPINSEDHAIYSLNEYPFPKPPTTLPNPTSVRTASTKQRIEPVEPAPPPSRSPISMISRADTTRDSAISMALEDSVLSVALEDDIETGIGLRLLAGLSGSEEDDYSDEEEDKTATLTQMANNNTPTRNHQPHGSTSTSAAIQSIASPPTSPRSAYDDSMDSEWDVGADIYDNYRYSRYSMSAKSSRTSTPRGGPLSNYFSEKPRERKESNNSSRFEKRRSTATTASTYSDHEKTLRRGDSIGPENDTLIFPMPPSTEPLNFVKKSSRPTPLNLGQSRQGVSSAEPTPPLTTPSPSTASSKHKSGGTNESRSPLLHTAFASPTASVYSSQTASLHIPFTEEDSGIRSSVATDITERMAFESVEAALEKATGGSLSKSGLKEQTVAGRKDSGDTVMENVDHSSHQDEEVIVFNGADFSRRSNGIVTTSPAKTDADTTLATDSSLSIVALTDPHDRTASPINFGDVSTLEPPQPITFDHASPPSPTPAFPPSPSTVLTHPSPSDPVMSRRSVGPSIFPPHPFAPQAPISSSGSPLTRGPSIHRTDGPSQGLSNSGQQRTPKLAVSPSLAQTLHQAALSYTNPPPNTPPQLRRAATIHGRTEKDLSSSFGPVPIAWTVDTWRERDIDKRKEDPPRKTLSKAETRMTIMMPTLVKRGSKASLRQNAPIPRANFNPNTGSPRPRSRSFSEIGGDNPFGTLPKRAGSPASPLASPKFPPPRTASPLSRPVITGTPPTPITSSSSSAFTGSSKPQNPHLTSSFEPSTRVPTSQMVSPTPPSQSMVQPPPRTVTLDGSMIGLGIGAGATAALTNTQVPPVASTPLLKSVASPPVQYTLRSSSPATVPMIPGERRAEGQRMLTRSPSPLGSAPASDPSSQHPHNMNNMPTARRDRAYSRASPSRPSTDLRSAPDAQLLSESSNFESLLPPARRAASPSSEVARSASSSPGAPSSLAASPLSATPITTQTSLRKAQSTASLRSLGSRSSQGGALRPNFERPYPFGEEIKSPMPPPVQPPSRRSSRFRSASRASSDRRPSIETTQSTDYSESVMTHSQQRTASTLDHDHGTSPPTSPVRAASLRSRRSFSQLRSKAIKPVKEITSPTQVEFEEETIQVKDMEFELVKPIIRHREHRDSDESAAESKEAVSPRTELRADVESIRSHSPALLAARSPDAQSPAASSVDSFPPIQGRHTQAPTPAAPAPQAADVNHEAHRARELKWISSMSSIPSTQARKNKKIRKLLQDPVPDSVRYLVWAHVLDAKAKRIQNVYAQIGNRPKGPISEQIERDAQRCFTQQPHLQDPKGPVISVVNAYLAMVPDIRYHPGITVIAGHLLLQSPEEDAFWIFLALMENHLRPYYALTGAQLEADAYLFTKVLESVDSQIAHVLFVDLRVRPIDVCRAWFPSIFAGILPNSHLHRVWDVLFYEGPVLLFRVGATLIQLARRTIIQSLQSTHPVLPLLITPDPELLPHAEIFLNHVLSLKVNDGDLRKQRIKVEASMRPPQRTPTTSRLRK